MRAQMCQERVEKISTFSIKKIYIDGTVFVMSFSVAMNQECKKFHEEKTNRKLNRINVSDHQFKDSSVAQFICYSLRYPNILFRSG